MKHKPKKIIALFLAVLTIISTFSLGFTAFAATHEVVQINMPRGNDPVQSGWGHGDLTLLNGWTMDSTSFTTVKAIDDYEGDACYCIEPGVALYTGDKLSKEAEGFWDNYPSKYNDVLDPDTIKLFIGRIMQYGYTGAVSVDWQSNNSGANKYAKYYATQILIWEAIVGERDEHFNKINAKDKGKDNAKQVIQSNHPLRTEIFDYYDDIVTKVQNHTKTPSFTAKTKSKAQTVELTWNGSEYTTTVTDSNGVLSGYSFSGSGLTFSKSGNKLTISATTAPTSDVTITASKGAKRKGVITWTDEKIGPSGKIQDMVTYGAEVSDPVNAYIKVKVSYGSAKIVKTSEDGVVNNIKFHIKGGNIDKDVTTNSKGEIQVDNLIPGKYTVTEYAIDRYEPQSSKTVTVQAGQTATVSFGNVLKKGDLQITKTSEDGLVEGVKFHLIGISLSGAKINEYATTNASGVATFKNILIGTGYTVEEVDTAIRYVIPDSQTTSIKWNEVTKASFTNKLKKFRVTVTKEDAEKKKAQGDATLAGATYGIYDNGKLIDTYVTDENASFTTKYYICGDHWSIREIKPSEGYLLNDTEYHVGAEAKLYKVEFNDTANTVTEPVIKGNISIIKHSDDGSTQIETPEPEAEFQVYLKSAGSYAKADKDERDVLDCDNDGFAQSKDLPYGVYTVHQTKGVEGSDFMQDFDVYIAKNGKTYKYLINNAPFKAYLKITKVDRETGKVVPYAGAGFEIYDSNGKKVSQTFTYPKKTTISTYYTNSEGYLITPEKLDYGKGYSLVEVQAPYGYVLDSTPIKFNVTRDNSELEDALTLIKVKRDNIAQKGIIEVTKSGEVFASVDNTDNIYTPVYEVQNLKGAVYQVFAAEDIKTPDGTLRYQQGEQVDEITTGNDGIAKTKQLYLGKYTVVERTAPVNFVNANQQYDVELVYAGQNVAVTSTALSVYNERQKVTTSLSKEMQKDETYKLGMNDEILSVQFGIYAAEEIKAADGSVIPADGLITLANCDKDGNITFDCDLPIGFKWYAKEIATDEHYILSEEQHFFDTEYAGQETAVIDIKLNDGEPIANNLIYGKVMGYKIDRETEKPIKDVVFGIFKGDETEYTEKTAITTATTDENGVFEFINVPYGAWIIRELTPAENYLENTDLHHFDVERNEKVIEMNIVNDRVPEMKTTATIDGEKTVCATETFTLTDTVEYQHLIPGKEYKVVGVLMDKSTGKELVINGDTFKSEVTFTPEKPNGSIDVLFTFDGKNITTDTNIVVFESLYKDGKELAVHADINDKGQTVTVKIPEIKTSAKADGKSEVEASKKITIVDTVTYKNLTVGKEYVISGELMDKSTGKPFLINEQPIRAEVKFTPDKSDGTVEVTFVFDGSGITAETELVVFETLYREGVEIATHADIEDKGQTVKITVPEKPNTPSKTHTPKTGDESNKRMLATILGASLFGIMCLAYTLLRKRKNSVKEDNDNEC
ncbi:MAG: VaFE repeat-containing surface-anchored protein [Clostridiales bacterium]|nr:VaFE repeat-containing surface-anchored protein [Clostridiales bacterium]